MRLNNWSSRLKLLMRAKNAEKDAKNAEAKLNSKKEIMINKGVELTYIALRTLDPNYNFSPICKALGCEPSTLKPLLKKEKN